MLEQLEFWHWWIFATVLIIVEVFAPGAIFMWMGVAAGVVGFGLLLLPDTGWEIQFLVFAVLSVGSVPAMNACSMASGPARHTHMLLAVKPSLRWRTIRPMRRSTPRPCHARRSSSNSAWP